jgi:signal transduction histidine kinase
LAIAGFGHLGYRLRVRRRLARERQRTRIAMDLHDEVGSGLGTIAVLAGIAGRPDLSEARRADVAGRIAAVSQELARALGDIVWSLRASSGSLDALWNQLLDRARPLFASGAPTIAFDAPDPVPSEALPLVVRRNLHLVVYEALHNAAKHAGASQVVLRLARDGTRWRLDVEDDGRGMSGDRPPASVRRGLGIEAMRARVAEMRGAIVWERGPSGGTRVSVFFRTGEG